MGTALSCMMTHCHTDHESVGRCGAGLKPENFVPQVLSAHNVIATYRGQSGNTATFTVEKYLRYTKMSAAGDPQQTEWTVDIGKMDGLVDTLAQEVEGSVVDVINTLSEGDRVE